LHKAYASPITTGPDTTGYGKVGLVSIGTYPSLAVTEDLLLAVHEGFDRKKKEGRKERKKEGRKERKKEKKIEL